ncbi:MAG: hypothetical protein HY321_00795 [Armatimonadetes bacterium]|nr:hypothetical protein [Armatimonadota bacterium]
MSAVDGGWPAEDAPRCARCGQPHLPVAGAGRFRCGNCGRPLVSRLPRAKKDAGARWAHRLLALALGVGVIALLLRAAPIRGTEQRLLHETPPRMPPAMLSPGSPTAFWLPQPRDEEMLTIPALEERIRELRLPEGNPDTYFRNMEVGDLLFLRGIQIALEVRGGAGQPPAGVPGESAWVDLMRWRMRIAHAVSGIPDAQQSLERAASAYEQALALARTRERKGRAHRSLGYVRFALGDCEGAMREADRVREILGEEDTRLRTRCLFGLGRVEEAVVLYIQMMRSFMPR